MSLSIECPVKCPTAFRVKSSGIIGQFLQSFIDGIDGGLPVCDFSKYKLSFTGIVAKTVRVIRLSHISDVTSKVNLIQILVIATFVEQNE